MAQNFVSLPPKAIHSIHTSLASVAGLTDILLVMGCQEVDRGSLGRRGRSGRDQLSSNSPAMMYCFVHAVLVVELPHTPTHS